MATNIQEQKASQTVLPSGPARLPYIGNLLSLRLDPLGYLQRLQRTYGNMATIYFGKNPAVLLFRPEYIRYVLVEHPRDFSNRGVLRNDNDDGFASEGLLTIDGESIANSAAQYNQLSTKNRLKAMPASSINIRKNCSKRGTPVIGLICPAPCKS